MSDEEPPLSSYNFDFAGGDFNSYLFVTLRGITYEVQFIPTPYLFGPNFVLADELVELVIKVAYNPLDRRPPSDPLVGPTVAAIIGDFYRKSSLTVTIFLCDTTDRRHKARWRKFNSWYVEFAESNYIRIDDSVKDAKQEVVYYCAVMVKHGNPYLREVGLAFFDMMADIRAGK